MNVGHLNELLIAILVFVLASLLSTHFLLIQLSSVRDSTSQRWLNGLWASWKLCPMHEKRSFWGGCRRELSFPFILIERTFTTALWNWMLKMVIPCLGNLERICLIKLYKYQSDNRQKSSIKVHYHTSDTLFNQRFFSWLETGFLLGFVGLTSSTIFDKTFW